MLRHNSIPEAKQDGVVCRSMAKRGEDMLDMCCLTTFPEVVDLLRGNSSDGKESDKMHRAPSKLSKPDT